jgi:protein-tyrosine-phosphatase
VLFLCVHNAGRSQMALGWFNHLAGDRAVAWSGGSEPGGEINPSRWHAMAEVGIDITGEHPKRGPTRSCARPTSWSRWAAATRARSIPGKRYEDWQLDDPPAKASKPCGRSATEIEQRVRTPPRRVGRRGQSLNRGERGCARRWV